MPTKHSETEPERGFDAAAESRRQSSVAAIREQAQPVARELVVAEDTPEYGTKKP